MTTLAQIADTANALPCVYNASVWQERRVYVNLVGANRSFAGDRNLKIFWEPKLGWVIEGLKGTMTPECRESLEAFRAAIA